MIWWSRHRQESCSGTAVPMADEWWKAIRSSAVPRLWLLDDWSALFVVSSGHWPCCHVRALCYAMRGFLQGYAPKPHWWAVLCKQRMNDFTIWYIEAKLAGFWSYHDVERQWRSLLLGSHKKWMGRRNAQRAWILNEAVTCHQRTWRPQICSVTFGVKLQMTTIWHCMDSDVSEPLTCWICVIWKSRSILSIIRYTRQIWD